ncbi:hypothetical protein SERLA73DRAFT_66101 [Serpula lacrymans var. lacrymans S7.3]|uniref:Uncharacterized protein n=1 Tax=Serpula lacrymans var. lacrymans (strain S7.3) TaxID=936435 RepID=F8QHI2_SERL3|nr:hypothetical protein SERLA73DRAFT_66101 [Serpula lacrymans var. lacrymans S7.3]
MNLEWDPAQIIFNDGHIYQHHILQVNYTSYDVQRTQDIIHLNTSSNHIMVFASSDDPSGVCVWYAKVLGIYHSNVIYVGPGMVNYQAHRIYFVWVRWYQCFKPTEATNALEELSFLPIDDNNTFGFIDPEDIL